MAGKRDHNKQQTKRATLEAAVRLFTSKGYDRTSITDLAREAGIGKGTIYSCFRNKSEIFLTFCEERRKTTWPQGTDITKGLDKAKDIGIMVADLENNILSGLVPMITGVSYDFHNFSIAWASESSQWWRSMAVVVAWGPTVAAFLILVVVPSMYYLLERSQARTAGLRAWLHATYWGLYLRLFGEETGRR